MTGAQWTPENGLAAIMLSVGLLRELRGFTALCRADAARCIRPRSRPQLPPPQGRVDQPASIRITPPPGALCATTRDTTDGIYRLTQVFTWDTTDLAVRVTMRVANLTSQTRLRVTLSRRFDGDIDNTWLDNFYMRTADTVRHGRDRRGTAWS